MSKQVVIIDEITPKLKLLDPRLLENVSKIFDYWQLAAESAMKGGARWTDRTGNARAGLVTDSTREGNVFTLYFASMASYGIWLEIRWSGKYAIVGPVMKDVAKSLAKMIADTALP